MNSDLRFTSKVQGVLRQDNPVDVLTAAGGSEVNVTCSVVPRVTVAQAPSESVLSTTAMAEVRMIAPEIIYWLSVPD